LSPFVCWLVGLSAGLFQKVADKFCEIFGMCTVGLEMRNDR